VDISGVTDLSGASITDLSGGVTTQMITVPTPTTAPVPVVGPDSPTQNEMMMERLHPLIEAFARQLETPSFPNNIYHDHDHQAFHEMLMNSADPPPPITFTHSNENYPRLQGNLEGDSIADLEPVLRALLQDHGGNSIESIDITYTVDYDVSGNS